MLQHRVQTGAALVREWWAKNMRFLCVSDIHGHADALAAVLVMGRAHGFDKLVACGDHVFPGPEPLRTWKTLVENQALLTQGVSDLALTRIDPDSLTAADEAQQQRLDQLSSLHGELGELIVAHLGKLSSQARLPLENGAELLVTHGSPMDPLVSFSPEMEDGEMLALIGDDPADIIVCGGSHMAFERVVSDVHIIGVGSVGEAPGGGYAALTFLESTPLGIAVEQTTVGLEVDSPGDPDTVDAEDEGAEVELS